MSPQNNSDNELLVYADWLEDSGNSDQSNGLRDEILMEKAIPPNLMIYLPSSRSGWSDGSYPSGVGTVYLDFGMVGVNNLHNNRVGAGFIFRDGPGTSVGSDHVGSDGV